MQRYLRLQDDPSLRARTPFYLTAYAAYRYGYCTMAAESLGGHRIEIDSSVRRRDTRTVWAYRDGGKQIIAVIAKYVERRRRYRIALREHGVVVDTACSRALAVPCSGTPPPKVYISRSFQALCSLAI
jgi:hypothetical protein